MKSIYLTFFMFVLTSLCYGQSDFEVANSFMSKKGIVLLNNEQSSNRAVGDKNYSIFHGEGNKGFAIVVNGFVIGYSTEDTIDEENIPQALNTILINGSNASVGEIEQVIEPIEPLITTKWNQTPPYNNLLSQKSGICSLVAWAQIVHYFRIPQTYCDVVDECYFHITLPSTFFNHENILDTYANNCEQEKIDEVAKFFYYMYYSFSAYVDPEAILNVTIETKTFTSENRNAELDESLNERIPLWIGNNNHAFVLDGRDANGYYHVNFGWGGSGNGYYLLLDGDAEANNRYETFTNGIDYYARIIPNDDWTTSMKSINKFGYKEYVYSINGMKFSNTLDNLPKGMYIVNGKKVIK